MKNLHQIDLNLLVYLEVLLRERNVTQAANQLGLSQPAMSNGLRRLRALFDDPLLVRTSEGMNPTERALELEPLVKEILLGVDLAMQPASEFAPDEAQMVVRIMASAVANKAAAPSHPSWPALLENWCKYLSTERAISLGTRLWMSHFSTLVSRFANAGNALNIAKATVNKGTKAITVRCGYWRAC